ncbi:MAG: glycosyltransferase family 4 protein [Planctomycetota bacterium]
MTDSAPPARVWLVLPGSLDATTGGTIYDRRLVGALQGLGTQVEVVELAGGYPEPDPAARVAAAEAFARIPDGAVAAVDGLALGALPEVAAAAATRLALVALVHHPLGDETGIPDATRTRLLASERDALHHAHRVVVTSAFTRARLVDLGLVAQADGHVFVAEPGVDEAPLVPERSAGATWSLVSLGAVTPRKAHADALRALDRVRDLDWTWTSIGRLDQDPRTAEEVMALARELELQDRVTFTGRLDTTAVEEHLGRAHLFLHPARYEGYGMAAAEALARGLPVVASRGGALAHTVPGGAGLLVEPGDVDALAAALRGVMSGEVMSSDATYARLRAGAAEARAAQRGWDATGRDFARALEGLAS